MSETTSAMKSLGIVVACCAAVVGGVTVRNLRDHQPVQVADKLSLGTLVASRGASTDVPEGDYFYEIMQLLKREYVDAVDNDQKLASGAVRGMISSLGDPRSTFMDKPEFDAFLNARQGKYEGIGADFALDAKGPKNPDALKSSAPDNNANPEETLASLPRIPRLTVTAVTPNGPAANAGVKVGDIVYAVDDHWLVNTDLLLRFRRANSLFSKGKMPLVELNKLRKEIREKTERALLPLKARAKLITGTEGVVNVVWERAGQQRPTILRRGVSSMPATGIGADGTLSLRLNDAGVRALRTAVKGKESLTIDLRNNTNGDYTAMKECLQLLAPAGKYGSFSTERGATPLVLKTGTQSPPKLNLVVDRSTRGAAEVLALALSSHAHATLSGQEMGGDHSVSQIVQLPDGSGYTLVIGEYRVTDTKEVKS